jgi:hypothetical protein
MSSHLSQAAESIRELFGSNYPAIFSDEYLADIVEEGINSNIMNIEYHLAEYLNFIHPSLAIELRYHPTRSPFIGLSGSLEIGIGAKYVFYDHEEGAMKESFWMYISGVDNKYRKYKMLEMRCDYCEWDPREEEQDSSDE